jgi:hypothetical protein
MSPGSFEFGTSFESRRLLACPAGSHRVWAPNGHRTRVSTLDYFLRLGVFFPRLRFAVPLSSRWSLMR